MPTLQAFDGDTLEAALARVAEQCGPGARITQAEKVRTGGIAGFFARERYEVTVEVEETAEAAATTGAPDAEPDGTAEPRSLLDMVEEVSRREQAATAVAPSTEGPTFREVLRSIASEAGLVGDGGGAEPPASGSEPAPSGTVPDPPTAPAGTDEHRPLFATLGIPAALLDRPSGSPSLAQRLLAVLEGVEPAPAVLARRGDVVAVVGEGRRALAAADLLAAELGQTADDVVVAAPDEHGFHTVSDADSARQRASLWRRCGVPFVVAVCAPTGGAGAAWARDVLAALDPVTVWAAVPAERKPDDVAAWAAAVGRVDALAVSGCDRTASPAAVLAAGIPVAALEGRRATPAAWTAILVERCVV